MYLPPDLGRNSEVEVQCDDDTKVTGSYQPSQFHQLIGRKDRTNGFENFWSNLKAFQI